MKKNVDFDAKIMESINIKDVSLIRFFGSIPSILFYQFVTKFVMYIVADLLNSVINLLIQNIGISAITNMDIPYLFKSWQGIIIIILASFILVVYAIFDIICMILISDNILHQKGKKIFTIMKEAIISVRYMLHPKAILVMLYVSIFAPLTISFFGISLTESFYIPSFIMQVVDANPMYSIPYYLVIILLSILGFIYCYSFHIMVYRKVNISEAMHTSRVMMTKYWWNFIKRIAMFWTKTGLNLVVLVIVFVLFPFAIIYAFSAGEISRFWLSFIAIHCLFLITLAKSLIMPFQFMELSRILESYTVEDEGELIAPKHSWHVKFWVLVVLAYGCFVGVSYLCTYEEVFDTIFPLNTVSEVVAHRAGGTLANENTLWGIEAAVERNVYASEIDIQRTKDGHYIVLHDDNFERICGVNKTPSELTVAECKKLKVKDTFNSTHEETELATIEEMLDACKGRIHLYVELKGATADTKMVDDLYQMIIDRDMIDDVTVISLQYNLIEYSEDNYPEIDTGYLCYVSLGDISTLKCDQLLLEDEMATSDVISEAHEVNKKVFIWTINTEDSMQKRMLDESDGIITDEVKMAQDLYNQLSKRDDFNRVYDILLLYLS